MERLETLEVKAGGRSRTVGEVVITGLGFAPSALWLDADGTFFASLDGWSATVREGWEDVLPQLLAAQQAADEKREAALAARLAHRLAKGLALTHARLFDSASGESRPGTTVVVVGDTIQAVGPDGSLAIPAGAEVVDAKGKALLPGLWDLHTHLTANDGLLNLAAGVTTVRDMANDIDQLTALKERWDSGRAIGPRVVRAGFMDSPGPYAGPSKVLVSTQAEAEAWVERYQKLGYEQIKIYSSMDPKLVPAIVAKAHGLGLRVSGHIPAFMTAEQAVREGFDEIQHVNFLFLNFLPVPDTRTPARFTEVAPGKLADLILVDGDPAARIADVRRVVLTVKGGTMYDAGELYKVLGVKPVVPRP